MKEYGTVISTFEGPSTRKFSFVINKDTIVRRGQFVQLNTDDGRVIGRVSDVVKTNRYFVRPESVKEYESSGRQLHEIFPVGDWEYLLAEVWVLGVFTGDGFEDSSFPPSPGTRVLEPEAEVLKRFFGLDPNGIHIGLFPHHDIDVNLNITRLFQKHLAVLALSGAGKSYLASVLLEELLSKKSKEGMAAIIVDPHGEYTSFAEDSKFASKIKVFSSQDIRIGLPNLSTYNLCQFIPKLSPPQMRELDKIVAGLRRTTKNYGIGDLIQAIESKEDVKTETKNVLAAHISDLARKGIFGMSDYPSLDDLVRQGELSVLDLSKEISIRKKQIIVAYIANKLFEYRRSGIIPPFLLILEESHQFAPETASRENAISKQIINTIAREGRKFHASLCLISQRPKYLATTALSQCNTHIILRITNPYDIKHIEDTSEGITSDVAKRIASLKVGTALIVGEGVNFPLFVKIRKRKSKESKKGMPLEEACKEYHEKVKKRIKDTKSFM